LPNSVERLLFGRSPKMALYSLKVVLGVIIGLSLGLLNVRPMGILEVLLFIVIFFGVLVSVTLLFKYIFNVQEKLVVLLLLNGTLGYFACILAFWALIINM